MQTVISDNESAPAAAPAASWRRLTHRACATLAVCSAIAALGWIAWICWRLVIRLRVHSSRALLSCRNALCHW